VPQLLARRVHRGVAGSEHPRQDLLAHGRALPYVVAPSPSASSSRTCFGDQYGIINTFLTDIGLPADQWHKDTFASHIAIATMVNFRWTGYNTLILLAAMQAIPRDYYEAATVDGAGGAPVLRDHAAEPAPHPHLRVITSTIGGLQIFDEPRMYDQTGTAAPTTVADDLALALRHRLGPVEPRARRRWRGSSSSSSW
jgi:cellobiose transport system permease protein